MEPSPRRTNRNRFGFSLIELAVVLIVIGVIAAIAIPTFQTVITHSRDRATLATTTAVFREASALAAFRGEGTFTEDDVIAAMGDLPAAAAPGISAQSGGGSWTLTMDPDEYSDAFRIVHAGLSNTELTIGLAARTPSGRCAFVRGTVGGVSEQWISPEDIGPDCNAGEAIDGNPDFGGPGSPTNGDHSGTGTDDGGDDVEIIIVGPPDGGDEVEELPESCGIAGTGDLVVTNTDVDVDLIHLEMVGTDATSVEYAAGLPVTSECLNEWTMVTMGAPTFSTDGGGTWMSLSAFASALHNAHAYPSAAFAPSTQPAAAVPDAAGLESVSVIDTGMSVGDHNQVFSLVHWGGGVVSVGFRCGSCYPGSFTPQIRVPLQISLDGDTWVTHQVTFVTNRSGTTDPASTRPWGVNNSVEIWPGVTYSAGTSPLASELGGPGLEVYKSAQTYRFAWDNVWQLRHGLFEEWPATTTDTDVDGTVTFEFKYSFSGPVTDWLSINPTNGAIASSAFYHEKLRPSWGILTSLRKCDNRGSCRIIHVKSVLPT